MTTIEKTPVEVAAVRVSKASKNRIKKMALEAAKTEGHVWSVLFQMGNACPSMSRSDIAEVVQELIDADVICLALDDEDWPTFFKCVAPGEPSDTEAVYFVNALEAFTEAERIWNLHHSELSEDENKLLRILQRNALSGVIRLCVLSEALRLNNLTVEAAWPLLESLADRHEIQFRRRIGTSELYIELQDVTISSVNQHIALPEMKKILDRNQRVVTNPRAFVLSNSLTAIGQVLSDDESTLLDAAQTLNKSFNRGGGVRETILHRVLQEYHNMDKAVRKQVISSLAERGILKRTVEDRTNIMRSVFRFIGTAGEEAGGKLTGIGQLIVKPEPVETPVVVESVAA